MRIPFIISTLSRGYYVSVTRRNTLETVLKQRAYLMTDRLWVLPGMCVL